MGDRGPRSSDAFAATETSGVGDLPAIPALLATTPASGDRAAGPVTAPAVGKLLANRFEILGAVGAGGMGIVYRAYDRSVDQVVALKVLHPNLAQDPRLLERFRQEVRLARLITHPAVCRLHDLEEADGLRFLTMELIDGETLAQRLTRDGRADAAEIVRIGRGIAAGLGAAHAVGVLHLDLKPGNVMLGRSGRVVVMDFGVSRLLGPAVDSDATAVAGTVAYMAPEQLAGQALDPRTDVYALGLVLYEMACGEVPLRGDSRGETALMRLGEEAPDPRLLRPDLPERLRRVIRRCLQRAPEQRFATVDDMWRELGHGHGLSPTDPTTPPLTPAAPPRPRLRLPVIGLLLALVAAGAVGLGLRLRSTPRTPLVGRIAVLAASDPAPTSAPASQRLAPSRARAMQRLVAQELRERGLAAAPAPTAGAGQAVAHTRLQRVGPEYIVEVDLVDPMAHVVRRGRAQSLADACALAAQALAEAVRTPPPTLDPREPTRVGTRSETALRAIELGRAALRHRDRDRAVRHARAAAVADPTLPTPHLLLAGAESAPGAASRAHLARARDLSRGRGDRHSRLALALARHELDNDAHGALQALAALHAEDPDDGDVAFAYADLLDAAGRGEQAIPVLERLLEAIPDHARAMVRLFDLRAGRVTVDQLLGDGERLVARAPELPDAAAYLGRARLAAGQLADALAAFGDALELDPDHALALKHRAHLLLWQGDLLGARAAARRLAVGEPRRRAEGVRLLGLSYLLEGRFATALRHLEDALKDSAVRPGELCYTHRLVVTTLEDLGDVPAAAVAARRWEEAAQRAGVWQQQVQARQRQDLLRLRQALVTRDELRRRLPAYLEALAGRGGDDLIARLQARHAFALEDYREALAAAVKVQTPCPELQFLIAECHARLGQHEAAARAFRRLLARPADEPVPTAQVRARLRLADELVALGRAAEARPLYAEFVAAWGSADRPLPEVDRARTLAR